MTLLTGLLVNPGDVVQTESPTYPGALEVFRHAAAVIRPRLEPGERPALMYAIPTASNPAGTIMDTATRRRLAAAATEHDVPLIDDEVCAELCFLGLGAASAGLLHLGRADHHDRLAEQVGVGRAARGLDPRRRPAGLQAGQAARRPRSRRRRAVPAGRRLGAVTAARGTAGARRGSPPPARPPALAAAGQAPLMGGLPRARRPDRVGPGCRAATPTPSRRWRSGTGWRSRPGARSIRRAGTPTT
ncbi:hypothetical protein [Nonomuraea dietziae]|uniref:hypothetical protein n=1 Tax=Nonomuraea dietziae TaxID=65515 RepID=UPI0031D47E21